MAKAVRPRDAATLVLLRQDEGRLQILMGRRASGHAFMPDKWVFPGGRLDRGDWHMQAASELRPEVAAEVVRTPCRPLASLARLARALALAAVRETFEETGLILGQRGEIGRRAPKSWSHFVTSGFLPDLSGLAYLARAITPPGRTRRFDTRFFLAEADRLASLAPADSHELHEIRWFGLDEARALDLPTVTRAVLDLVEAYASGRPLPPPFWAWNRRVAD
ncbi:NUDIX hydrolase [Thermaurantiacus sp.]